jgi:NADPH:quinone reductase-like Zn-dependent oxidoreductase
MDFGRLAHGEGPIDQPAWCTLTSAMRVAQNEYSGVQIRCLGLAGADDERTKKQAVEELLSPDDEREIFIDGESRSVIRVTQPIASPAEHEEGAALRLRTTSSATRGALVWEADDRSEPGPGEIEIKVAAVGLNFRDVMWNLRLLPEEALEEGYAGTGLGMECAGTVSKVSPDVEGLQPGDRVLAFAPKAFSSHVIVPAFAASRLPDQLSFQAATTVPVAFLTAYYSLVHLAQLRAGETVLIHGGAGAVGLAAIQIARHCGATVIATAGSHEKRALLRSLGVDLACNSRTLSFADEIMAHTRGKGVDVVLNSLAEEAMLRSFDCLAPFGRFVELGKRDFFANTHLRLRPLRRNISYFGVDVDQLLGQHKDLTARLFGELLGLFAQGDLVPLPYQVVPGERVADAFRLMQRSGTSARSSSRRPPTRPIWGGRPVTFRWPRMAFTWSSAERTALAWRPPNGWPIAGRRASSWRAGPGTPPTCRWPRSRHCASRASRSR